MPYKPKIVRRIGKVYVGFIMLVLLECSINRYMYIKPLSAHVDINEKYSLSTAKLCFLATVYTFASLLLAFGTYAYSYWPTEIRDE